MNQRVLTTRDKFFKYSKYENNTNTVVYYFVITV